MQLITSYTQHKKTMKRKITQQERKVFTYLNKLRESGAINMFGATPYIETKFHLNRKQSTLLLSLWMGNFNDAGVYEEIES